MTDWVKICKTEGAQPVSMYCHCCIRYFDFLRLTYDIVLTASGFLLFQCLSIVLGVMVVQLPWFQLLLKFCILMTDFVVIVLRNLKDFVL